MTDSGGGATPPAWPTQAQTPAGAAPPRPPAPPSWGEVQAGRPWWRRDINLKVLIAVLIGLVSVTGAVLTYQAALLAEEAADKDRQAVAESAAQQQNAVNVENRVRDEQQAFAEYRAHLANAEQLEVAAGELRAAGRDDDARDAEDEASVVRELADRLAFHTFSLDYVTEDPDTGVLSFDERQRRDDLIAQNEAATQVDPEQTSAEAVDLRRQSQRLVGWIIALVTAVLILTVAQISQRPAWRPAIAGAGVAVFLVATVIAFGGS